jgi:Cd2+/Zn2+-exporting ATPase
VLPGERIPLDGSVCRGSSFVNSASLTGEAVPRKVESGDSVLGGFVNDEGRIVVPGREEFSQGAAARILELVENASAQKDNHGEVHHALRRDLHSAVVVIAALIAFVPPLLVPGARLEDWVYRALVMLVISCPCALVISIPLGYFGGIGGASRNKLLIKGGNYIDALTKVDTVVFDMYGTLTEGVFNVVKVEDSQRLHEGRAPRMGGRGGIEFLAPIARSIKDAAGGVKDKASDIGRGEGTWSACEGRGPQDRDRQRPPYAPREHSTRGLRYRGDGRLRRGRRGIRGTHRHSDKVKRTRRPPSRN